MIKAESMVGRRVTDGRQSRRGELKDIRNLQQHQVHPRTMSRQLIAMGCIDPLQPTLRDLLIRHKPIMSRVGDIFEYKIRN